MTCHITTTIIESADKTGTSYALRAYCAHGTWALAFAALAGITFHKFMWTSFSLNMAFASRTTKQFLNELEDDFEDLI